MNKFTLRELYDLKEWFNQPASNLFFEYLKDLIEKIKNFEFNYEMPDPIAELRGKARAKGQVEGLMKIYKIKERIEEEIKKSKKSLEEV